MRSAVACLSRLSGLGFFDTRVDFLLFVLGLLLFGWVGLVWFVWFGSLAWVGLGWLGLAWFVGLGPLGLGLAWEAEDSTRIEWVWWLKPNLSSGLVSREVGLPSWLPYNQPTALPLLLASLWRSLSLQFTKISKGQLNGRKFSETMSTLHWHSLTLAADRCLTATTEEALVR